MSRAHHESPTVCSRNTASEKCQQEKRKTVNGEDILFAMTSLGFENYAEALKIYLSKYREVSASHVAYLQLLTIYRHNRREQRTKRDQTALEAIQAADLLAVQLEEQTRLEALPETNKIQQALHKD